MISIDLLAGLSLAEFAEAIPPALFIKDADSRIVLMNRLCEEHWGIQAMDIVGTDGSDFFPPDQMAGFRITDRKAFDERQSVTIEEDVWNSKLKESRRRLTVKKPVYGPTGESLFLICMTTDITDRKNLEDDVEQLKEKLNLLYQMSPIVIALTNLDGHYIEFNPAFERICGYSLEELQKLDYWALTPKQYMAQEQAQIESMARTKQYGPYRKEYIRKDGSLIPLELKGVLVTGKDNKPYIWSIVEDVTERLANEAKQAALSTQLMHAQKMEALGQLTGGIAHDFNNLLGIVIGNLDLMENMMSSGITPANMAELGELRDAALTAALRGGELTRGLLTFASRQPLQPRLLDLNSLVSNLFQLLRRTIGTQIDVGIDLHHESCLAIADPAQLEAAITNLVMNARDAMPEGGHIHLSIGHSILDQTYAETHRDVLPGPYIWVRVTDSGTGISSDLLPRIFEPFFTTKPRERGTGLGLSMVFGFVKQSCGHIHVESKEGVGSCFTLYLQQAEASDQVASEPSEQELKFSGNAETILIAEDNAAFREIVSRQLEALNYRTLEARDATEAMRVLEGHHVDLLLTDIVMPGDTNGVTLALNARSRWPNLRIVLTSGFPDSDFGEDPAASNLPLLVKPYRQRDLAKLLRETLSR